MSSDYKSVLGEIRQAYVRLQSGALRTTVWKREGASSYTVQRAKQPAKVVRQSDAPVVATESRK